MDDAYRAGAQLLATLKDLAADPVIGLLAICAFIGWLVMKNGPTLKNGPT